MVAECYIDVEHSDQLYLVYELHVATSTRPSAYSLREVRSRNSETVLHEVDDEIDRRIILHEVDLDEIERRIILYEVD